MQSNQIVPIVTQNRHILELITQLDKISQSNSTVLLMGETGVGKEIFADYIHHSSLRKDKAFVKVGLAALPADLLESELFGHEKGAYTSAHCEKKGLFELAEGGSIFLDDIDDVPLNIQAKLLRVLESRELMRIGGTKSIPVDVRLIAATKIDLKLLIEQKKFRSDLYYRINVVPINILPLRERRDDVPLLVSHFLKRYSDADNLSVSPEAENALKSYNWPGNVRELRNVTQRLALFVEDKIQLNNLPPEIRQRESLDVWLKACDLCFTKDEMSFNQVMTCLEIRLLKQALMDNKNNQSQAARTLKISLSTFRDKLKKHHILKSPQCQSAEIRKL